MDRNTLAQLTMGSSPCDGPNVIIGAGGILLSKLGHFIPHYGFILSVFIFFPLLLFGTNLGDSNLPIVHISTHGEKIVDDPKITASMTIYWMPEERTTLSESSIHYDGLVGIELRGNSSQSWPKKPYRLETRDENGVKLNFSLLGLPKENDWVLHAPYVDKTLLRNALIYRVLNEMGWYAPRYRYCELLINNDYKGVYLLVENLKIDDNRINITRTSAKDLTGGYLLELTTAKRLQAGEPYVETNIAEQVMAIKYPKEDELTKAHENYIKSYLNDFEKSLYEKHFSGALDYKNYIDVASFIDHMLVSEVFRQLDAFTASHHFYKDAQGKLIMGPGWDYNRSIGNYNGHDVWKTDGFWLTSYRGGFKPFWPKHIYEDESFMKLYRERYAALRETILNTGHISAIIDEYSLYLNEAKGRNFEVWDIMESRSHKYVQGSYEGEINYVKNWLNKRFNWLDQQWDIASHPVISEFYANGDGTRTQWVELYNPYGTSVDISGWSLSVNDDSFTFPKNTSIGANTYLVLTVDKNKFMSSYSGNANIYGGLKGDLLDDDITLKLLNSNVVVDKIHASVSEGWPPVSQSGNYAIGMRPIAFNNEDGRYWNWSTTEGGSPGAPNEIFNYKGLIITEIMSSNGLTIADGYNEYDDWLELSNTTNFSINLNGLYLSDKLDDYGKWQLKDPFKLKNTILEPGESVLFWLDSDADVQSNFHTNFSVKAVGERVILSYFDGYNYQLIDQVFPSSIGRDQSYQLLDVGTDEWQVSDNPTPGIFGNGSTGFDDDLLAQQLKLEIYPNPVQNHFNLDFHIHTSQTIQVFLFDNLGRSVMPLLRRRKLNAGHYNYPFTLKQGLPDGMYILQLRGDDYTISKKLLLVKP